jgi:hypothetical protein
MLCTNNSLVNIESGLGVPTKQKGLKVSFTDSGLSNSLAHLLILVAVAMAAKQEERSSGDKDVHTVLTLGSGSQWGSAELDYFRARFEQDKFDPLPDVVVQFTPQDVPDSGMQDTTDVPVSETQDKCKHQLNSC